jgi:hypothetical protein
MATSSHDLNPNTSHPDALIDLEIPGNTGPLPVPPAQSGERLLGINHGAAMDNFPEQGLQLYLPVWSVMSEGDSVKVLLDDVPVATEFIAAAEVGQRVTTFINAARLAPGAHTVKYVVTRVGQSPETSSESRIWVKLTRPGGQDQDGDTPGHSALQLTLTEDVINNGVDADAAAAGVPVTIEPYPDMSEKDNVRLSWGGWFVEHTVTEPEVNNPIEIMVEESVILAAGDSGADGLAVTYEVYDVVKNRSEDWAAEKRIVVDTGNSRLEAPFVDEAINNVLDLDTLGNNPVTLQVVAMGRFQFFAQFTALLGKKLTAQLEASLGKGALKSLAPLRADFAVGDKIFLKLTGTTADGEPLLYEAEPITIDRVGHIFEILVPNAQIRRLAKTQAVFTYDLKDTTDTLKAASKGAFINVIGETVRMAAPVALDAQQGALDPDLPQTTVQIPWDDSMAAGDVITLKWIGTRPDLTIYDPELPAHVISNREATNKYALNFTVPGTHLTPIDGGTLVLHFLLTHDDNGTIIERKSALSATLTVGEARAELPAPEVKDVVNGVLDPALPGTTLTVPVYPEMAALDNVVYQWKGSQGGEVQDFITLTSATVNKPVVFSLYPEDISSNDGGTVEASYRVERVGGRISYSDVNRFNVGKPIVLDPPAITGIKDSNGQDIPDGGVTADTRVTLSGTAPASQAVELFDGAQSKGQATAGADGTLTKELTDLAVGSHALKAKSLYGDGAESAVRGFTVAAVVAPTISSIKAASGADIPAGGITVETSVTVTGAASAGLEVEVFDGSASKGKATANINGQWTFAITGLADGAHAIKAKALYGNGDESAIRTFDVMLDGVPTIDYLQSGSSQIPDGGEMYRDVVKIAGKAAPGLQVEVFDNGVTKGKATAHSTSGVWFTSIEGLALGRHAIKAKALYGRNPESNVRSFSRATPQSVTSIKDSSGREIPEGGSTTDPNITVTGLGNRANQKLTVVNFSTVIADVWTDADSRWTTTGTVSKTENAIWCQGGSDSQHSYIRHFTWIR